MPRSRSWSLALSLLCSTAALAQFPEKEPYVGVALGGNLVLAPWDLGTHTETMQPQSSFLGALRVGFQLNPRLAFELSAAYLPQPQGPSGGNAVLAYDATVLYHLMEAGWSPFVLGGLGAYHSPGGDLGFDVDPQLHLGVGFRGLLLPWLALRAQVRHVVSDGFGTPSNTLEFSLGVDVFPASFNLANDRDRDGIANETDRCPDVAGPISTQGCPDADNDGIADADDVCRLEAGTPAAHGCPDRDRDGIADAADACPEVAGSEAALGCPDEDKDGVADRDDACPRTPGVAKLAGCPDADGDGIADADDLCPRVAGSKAFKGCPDTDGDGLEDSKDKCPQTAGPLATQGCPDKDHDGVADADDQCPDQPGLASEHGCLPKEMQKFSGAIKGIQFAPGKAEILKPSFSVLDGAADVLKKFPSIRLRVEGHTDNDGVADKNLLLSKDRAAAVKAYLVKKGIDGARLESEGYGDTRPVADNKTPAGRAQNRRVEFTALGQ